MITKTIRENLEHIWNSIDFSLFEDANVLISGGSGFIGSWLVDVLYPFARSIYIVDNLSTSTLDNIKHILSNTKIHFVKADISNPNVLELLKKIGKLDFVLHLAARAGPEDFMRHPVETALTNSIGTWVMLEIALQNDAIFFFSSSSEVYGQPTRIPTPEDYWGYVNPIGPRSAYDESKRFSEALAMAYYREYGLDVRIVRIFNTYGPRLLGDSPSGRVINRFIERSLKNLPIIIYGDGRQTRSFTYITDTLRGILLAITTKRARGEVFNIGNPTETSILNLARIIIRITESKSKIIFEKSRPEDPLRRLPDISKAKKILSWTPIVSLEEGLKRTIQWYREAKL